MNESQMETAAIVFAAVRLVALLVMATLALLH